MRGSIVNFRLNALALFIFAFIGCLLTRGYQGVSHDAVFYLAQAINVLEPTAISQDLFFRFGSQQSFTLFPWLYAQMIAVFGVSTATLLLLLLAKALFALGLVLLMARLFDRDDQLLSILGVLLFSSYYGGFDILSYSEPFLTGRSLAEPLVLISLAMAVSRRYGWALMLVIASTAFHPLQGLGAALAIGLIATGRYRWLVLMLGFAIVLFLAGLGVTPFSWLFERYDTLWWQLITENNALTRMALWRAEDWARLIVDVSVLVIALFRVIASSARQLVYCLLWVALALFSLAFLAGELGRLQLIHSLQLWRVHWCLHLLACASTLPLGAWLWRQQRELTAGFLVFTVLIAGNEVAPFSLLATVLVYWAERKLVAVNKAPVLRTMILAVIGSLLVLPVLLFLGGVSYVLFKIVALMILVSCALLVWILLVWRWGAKAYYLAMIPMVLLSLLTLDQRGPAQRALTDHQYSDIFSEYLDESSSVYWHDSNELAWLVAHLPNYYSHYQGAGMLFNRATAMEFRRRDQQLRFLRTRTRQCRQAAPVIGPSASNYCKLSYSEIVTACKNAGELDYVVVREFGNSEHTIAVKEMAGQLVKLYSCEEARKNG